MAPRYRNESKTTGQTRHQLLPIGNSFRYGVGARLDEDPTIFFTLRGVDTGDLIKRTVSSKAEDLLKKASKKSPRIIEGADLSSAFGIDLAEEAGSPTPDDAAGREMPVDRRVFKAGVRKPRKKGMKKNAGPPLKEKPSKKSGVKKMAVKRKAKGTVKEVVSKQARSGKKK